MFSKRLWHAGSIVGYSRIPKVTSKGIAVISFLQNLFGMASSVLVLIAVISVYAGTAVKDNSAGLGILEGAQLQALDTHKLSSFAKIGANKALEKNITVGIAFALKELCSSKVELSYFLSDSKNNFILADFNNKKNEFTVKSIGDISMIPNKECLLNFANTTYLITDSQKLRQSFTQAGVSSDYAIISPIKE